MNIHASEKDFKCKLCERCFTRKDKMCLHTRLHTGEKPFECDICRYSYSRRDAMNIYRKGRFKSAGRMRNQWR